MILLQMKRTINNWVHIKKGQTVLNILFDFIHRQQNFVKSKENNHDESTLRTQFKKTSVLFCKRNTLVVDFVFSLSHRQHGKE